MCAAQWQEVRFLHVKLQLSQPRQTRNLGRQDKLALRILPSYLPLAGITGVCVCQGACVQVCQGVCVCASVHATRPNPLCVNTSLQSI